MGDDAAAKPDAVQPEAEITAQQNATAAAQASEDKEQTKASKPPTSIWRCIMGSGIAGVMGYGTYSLTFKIATQFASHPLVSDNYIAVRLSGMVRTLVLGVSAMATGLLAFAALGLAILGLQTAIQKLKPDAPAGS